MTDFFEPPPRIDREPEPSHDWEGPPDGAVPVTVPIEKVVAKTAETAIYLASVSAYPTGFEFDVFVVTSDRDSPLDPFGFDYRMLAEHTGEIPAGQLRIGFLFADGSKATNTGKSFDWAEGSEESPDPPYMSGYGEGGGSDHNWHGSFWVWPLPPPGKLEFLCEWPEADIPLTPLELDASLIVTAATGSQVIPRSD
jgi:hypothetical protein